MTETQTIKALTITPDVGKSIAADLYNIGIRHIDDLKDKDPQELYDNSNQFAGCVQDRCLLYVLEPLNV
ncbi:MULTISPECIES: helix-hairpin-helix domain-containing protein [Chitinophagaceae]